MTTLRYQAVLFDLDGTLVDSYSALADAVNYARREHGMADLPGQRVRDFVGDGIERLLQRAFDREHLQPSIQTSFESRYDAICCEQSRVLEDVEVTLRALSGLGVAMAVCTNKPTSFSRKILEYLELADYFRAIVGPDLAGARKPDGRHVLRTLEEAGCSSTASALFVGDMPVDIHAARNSGIDVAVVPSGSSTRHDLDAARPDHLLDGFADLVALVAGDAR
jgi:phosphoglycolate phosphatase